MNYVASFSFDGQPWTDDYSLRSATPLDRLCSDSWKRAACYWRISMPFDSAWIAARALSRETLVRIYADGILVFAGRLPAIDSWTEGGAALGSVPDISDLEMEVLDRSDLLERKITPEDAIAWEVVPVCDPAQPAASITHRLLSLAGVTGFIASATSTTVLHAYAPEEGGTIGEALDSLLYQHGLVLRWVVDHFETFQWLIEAPAPELDLDEDLVMSGFRPERVEREADAVEVVWHSLKDKADCLLYMADLPFGEDNQRSGYPIQAGLLWPEEANPPVGQGGIAEAWWQYEDRALTSTVELDRRAAGLVGSKIRKNTDFTQIVLTKNHRVEAQVDAGIIDGLAPVYQNRRARLAWKNPTAGALSIWSATLHGDVIYRGAENKVLKSTVPSPKKTVTIVADHVHDETSATRLACSLADLYGSACWRHSFKSETLLELGLIGTIRSPYSGLESLVILVERGLDLESGIYSYKALSIKPVTIAPTASYVAAALTAPHKAAEDPRIQAQLAAPGPAGLNSATITLYKRAAASPAKPTAASTYTFATGALAGQDGGWTQTIPAADGNPLWVILATAAATTATDAIPAAEWSAPAILAQDGAAGAAGANTAIVYLYQRAAAAPVVTDIADPVTYTFASKSLTEGALGAWTQTIPAGTNPLYVIAATAFASGATDTIARSEWSTPQVLAQNGAKGDKGDTGTTGYRLCGRTLFKWANATPTGTWPSGAPIYTWATASWAAGSEVLNGWTTTPGLGSPGQTCYAVDLLFTDNGTSATSQPAWPATPAVYAFTAAGANGAPGAQGPRGYQGAFSINQDPYFERADAWESSGSNMYERVNLNTPEGQWAIRSPAGASAYVCDNKLYPIDRSKSYRVRFWAYADSAVAYIYFCLRQHTGATWCAANGGRSPYKPAPATMTAGIWTLFEFTWGAADWQADMHYVQPDWLLNYNAQPGFMYIAGFTMTEVLRAGYIEAGSITATEIAAGTITAAKINATDFWSQNIEFKYVLRSTGAVWQTSGVYMDLNAYFSLGDKLRYTPAAGLTITGKLEATEIKAGSYLGNSTGNIRIYGDNAAGSYGEGFAIAAGARALNAPIAGDTKVTIQAGDFVYGSFGTSLFSITEAKYDGAAWGYPLCRIGFDVIDLGTSVDHRYSLNDRARVLLKSTSSSSQVTLEASKGNPNPAVEVALTHGFNRADFSPKTNDNIDLGFPNYRWGTLWVKKLYAASQQVSGYFHFTGTNQTKGQMFTLLSTAVPSIGDSCVLHGGWVEAKAARCVRDSSTQITIYGISATGVFAFPVTSGDATAINQVSIAY